MVLTLATTFADLLSRKGSFEEEEARRQKRTKKQRTHTAAVDGIDATVDMALLAPRPEHVFVIDEPKPEPTSATKTAPKAQTTHQVAQPTVTVIEQPRQSHNGTVRETPCDYAKRWHTNAQKGLALLTQEADYYLVSQIIHEGELEYCEERYPEAAELFKQACDQVGEIRTQPTQMTQPVPVFTTTTYLNDKQEGFVKNWLWQAQAAITGANLKGIHVKQAREKLAQIEALNTGFVSYDDGACIMQLTIELQKWVSTIMAKRRQQEATQVAKRLNGVFFEGMPLDKNTLVQMAVFDNETTTTAATRNNRRKEDEARRQRQVERSQKAMHKGPTGASNPRKQTSKR